MENQRKPIRRLEGVPDARSEQLTKHRGKRGFPFVLAPHRSPALTHAERMFYRRQAQAAR